MSSQAPRVFVLHNLREGNGKTIRENNLERKHQVPVGTKLRMVSPDPEEPDYALFMPGIEGVVTCYVVMHTRDCDGTPLYALSPYSAHKYDKGLPLWEWLASIQPGPFAAFDRLMMEAHRVSGGLCEEMVMSGLPPGESPPELS